MLEAAGIPERISADKELPSAAKHFMALDKRLLDILCCPSSKQPLLPLQSTQRERINAAISKDGLPTGAGETTRDVIQDGLITRDGKTVYRIDDGIPVLLAEEALDVRSIDSLAR